MANTYLANAKTAKNDEFYFPQNCNKFRIGAWVSCLKMQFASYENKIVRHENIFMACFSYFCPPKRTQTDRKRIKNLAVRVFFLHLSAELRQSYFSRYYLESLNIFD